MSEQIIKLEQEFAKIGQTLTEDVAKNTSNSWYYTNRLSVTLNSINKETLTANVTMKGTLISRYVAWSNDTIIFRLGVNGETKESASASSGGNGQSSSTSKTYVTWNGDIPYDDDGTLTAVLTFTTSDNNGVYSPPNQTAEIVATFPFIPRASSIASISGDYLGNQVTVALDRKVDEHIHKVEYSFAGSEWITVTSNGGTSVSFKPSLELASNIPNSTSGSLTVRVTTLNGSTKIGEEVTSAIPLKLPDSVVPLFDSLTVSPLSYIVPSEWVLYVRTLSSAVIEINGAKGIYGSSIDSYEISGGGFSGTDSYLETDIINSKGNITFTATITDSRGRKASKTETITVVDYFKPSISVIANRCDANGNLVSNGTYLKVTATYSYASVSNKNTIEKSVDCNGAYDTSFESGKEFVFDCDVSATQGYILTASIYDALGGYDTVTIKIDSDSTLFVVNEDKDGIVFGSYEVEKDKFKVDMPMKVTKTLDMAGNKIINAIIEGYSGGGGESNFTNEEKEKLAGIEEGAEKNVVTEVITSGGGSADLMQVTTADGNVFYAVKVASASATIKPSRLPTATQSAQGAMSKDDKKKLDGFGSASEYAKQSDVTQLSEEIDDHVNDTTKHITSAERTTWNNKSNFSGKYADLSGKPTIPSKTSQLSNDSGFTTSTYVDGKIDDLQSQLEAFTSAKAEGNTLEEQISWLYANGDTTKEYLLLDGHYYAYEQGGELVYTNLFSFENANTNFSWVSGSTTDMIYDTSSDYGYKDTSNNRFVSKKSSNDGRFAVTGGIATLPNGDYTVSADVFVPSTAPNRYVQFGVCLIPNAKNSYKQYAVSTKGTWETLSYDFTVASGNLYTYVAMMGGSDNTSEIYWRNVKVISKDDEGTYDLAWVKTNKTVSSVSGAKKWVGKKWVAFGDSLTEVNERTTKHYHDYIADETGIEVVNMGDSGSGYKREFDSNTAFYQRILNVPTDANVVTIFGSGNDLSTTWNTYGLGNVTDNGTDTICGCINKTIDNLYSVLPTVQLGIITPTPWDCFYPSATADPQNRMTLYSEAIVEICKMRGIPCLDLYHCSGLRPWDSNFKTLAYSKDDGGGTHPDETGHLIIAPRIKAFLESLLM